MQNGYVYNENIYDNVHSDVIMTICVLLSLS